MLRPIYPFWHSIAFSFVLIVCISCNNSSNIPFPDKELSFSQPVTEPLKFSTPKKLRWDSAGKVNFITKSLDINQLASTPCDTAGFKPFTEPPEEFYFDFNSLPGATLNLENLPSKPLQFKTSVLVLPPPIKTSAPFAQKNRALSIYDVGQPQGLPSKFISCLLKDRNGMMWVADNGGLFRYDGEQMQTFIPATTLPFINGMTEDNQGNIWYGYDHGMGMIDLQHGTINYSDQITTVTYNLNRMSTDKSGLIWVFNNKDKAVSIIDPVAGSYRNLTKQTGLSDSTVFQILKDDKKHIWITTYAGGADIIDLSTNTIKYLRKKDGMSTDSLSAIAKDNAGLIWIGGMNGVNAIDITKGVIRQFKKPQGCRNAYNFSLSVDRKGRLWRGTFNGLEILDPVKGMIKYITPDHGLTANLVTECIAGNDGKVWVATIAPQQSIGSINIIDQDGETVHLLGAANVISLMDDDVGNLWVATQNGVVIVNAARNTKRLLDKSHGLSDNFVQSITKREGKIIVTTDGGFNIIDPLHKSITSVGKKEGLVNDTIYGILTDKAGNIWVAGPSNGVDLIDAITKKISHVDTAGGLNDVNVQDIKQDEQGNIWLATTLGGIDIIDPVNGTIKYLDNQPGLKDTCNKVVMRDKYGRMWIGTDKGIYVVDIKLATITTITTEQGLPQNAVISLLEYKESVVAGTRNMTAIITAPSSGVSGNEWKVTLLDKSQNLIKETGSWNADWITKKGEYLWGDRGITIIHEIRGWIDSSMTYVTGVNAMTQPLHFVNTPSFNGYDTLWTTDSFFLKGQKPDVAGYSAGKKTSWDSVSGPYNMPTGLNLPYYYNYIQFQFARSQVNRIDTTRYCYILEGIDKNWSSVTTNTYSENYLNLPPGEYTFKVCSKGAGGKWGAPAVFHFTISPPWYKTWWAYTLLILIIIGSLRTYIIYRSRMLQKENRILEEKVALRTIQLQASVENLKATQSQLVQSEKMASLGELTAGIAHEIQNPLNFVNNFSEVSNELIEEMMEEMNKGNADEVKTIANDLKQNLEKIGHHGKRADAIVKGMLQHSRTSSAQKELVDINALCDEYLRLSYHGLRAKDKSFNAKFETDFNPSAGKINIIQQDIGRVILNLINNSFYAVNEKKKLNIPGFEPTVIVSTRLVPSHATGHHDLEIAVKDNGMGIPHKVVDKIFQPFFTTKPTGQGTGLGLSLSYDIVKAHGGELKVITKEGEGSEFIIQLPA